MIDEPTQMPGSHVTEPPTCHVVVPYGDEQPDQATADAVMTWGGDYVFEHIETRGDYAYPDAMATWWSAGVDLVIVHREAEVRAGLIRELLACPRPWCMRARIVPGVGPRWNRDLVKISAQTTARHPGLIGKMIEYHSEQGNSLEWSEWDAELGYLLGVLGVSYHVHYPPLPGEAGGGFGGGGD